MKSFKDYVLQYSIVKEENELSKMAEKVTPQIKKNLKELVKKYEQTDKEYDKYDEQLQQILDKSNGDDSKFDKVNYEKIEDRQDEVYREHHKVFMELRQIIMDLLDIDGKTANSMIITKFDSIKKLVEKL